MFSEGPHSMFPGVPAKCQRVSIKSTTRLRVMTPKAPGVLPYSSETTSRKRHQISNVRPIFEFHVAVLRLVVASDLWKQLTGSNRFHEKIPAAGLEIFRKRKCAQEEVNGNLKNLPRTNCQLQWCLKSMTARTIWKSGSVFGR